MRIIGKIYEGRRKAGYVVKDDSNGQVCGLNLQMTKQWVKNGKIQGVTLSKNEIVAVPGSSALTNLKTFDINKVKNAANFTDGYAVINLKKLYMAPNGAPVVKALISNDISGKEMKMFVNAGAQVKPASRTSFDAVFTCQYYVSLMAQGRYRVENTGEITKGTIPTQLRTQIRTATASNNKVVTTRKYQFAWGKPLNPRMLGI